MKRQKKRQQGVYGKEERLFDGMIYIVLFLVLALMVYPLIYVVSCSFSDPLLVLRGEIRLLPRGFHLDSYAAVSNLNLLNTMWSIVLPNAVSVTNFIIMKSSFENGIPKDLKEAARVEGCSNIGVFTKIVLPLSKSIIAVMVIFYSVGHWNEYFNALLYITDKAKQPLQVILRDILISNELTEMMGNVNQLNSETRAMIAEGMKYSTIVLSSLPMILLYPFFQKYFVKGVMVGSVKG